jgi:hypothetical protein
MDLTQHDMEEMKMAAEKTQLKASPHSRKMVAIDADKLLWLLEQVEEHTRYLKHEQHLYDQETEKTINEQVEQIQQLQNQIDELKGE